MFSHSRGHVPCGVFKPLILACATVVSCALAQNPDDFVDTWVNVNPETDGIPQLVIGRSGDAMTVHGFGACSPSWCDWGQITVPFTGNPFVAVYRFGFVTETLTICLPAAEYLYVHSYDVFHDGSARDFSADYFFYREGHPLAGAASGDDFVDTWVSMCPESEATAGLPTVRVTRLTVEREGDGYTLHAYGVCEPNDCEADWGSITVPSLEDLSSVSFDTGLEVVSFVFRLVGKSFLHLDGGRRAENVLRRESFRTPCCGEDLVDEAFSRGDANADRRVNIADVLYTLGHILARQPAPTCLDSADANDDGKINIADAIAILGHLFGSAGPLPEPFGSCGTDPTPDELGCSSFEPCKG